MNYGYIRPTVADPKGELQVVDVKCDKLFQEPHGLAKKRKVLEQVLMLAQKNDKIYVQNIEVLADSFQQLLDVLRLAERDQICIHFIDEQLTSHSLLPKSLLEITTFFTQLQATFSRHSAIFSAQAAKEQGKTIGRPKKSDEKLQLAFQMYEEKDFTLFDIKEATGISKSTLYRYLDQRASHEKKE